MQTDIACPECSFTQVRKIYPETEEEQVLYCCAGCNIEVTKCRGCRAGLKETKEIDNGVYLVCVATCGWEMCLKGPTREAEGPWGLGRLMQQARYR